MDLGRDVHTNTLVRVTFTTCAKAAKTEKWAEGVGSAQSGDLSAPGRVHMVTCRQQVVQSSGGLQDLAFSFCEAAMNSQIPS